MGLKFPVHTKNIYESNIRSLLAVSVVYLIGYYKLPLNALLGIIFACRR